MFGLVLGCLAYAAGGMPVLFLAGVSVCGSSGYLGYSGSDTGSYGYSCIEGGGGGCTCA